MMKVVADAVEENKMHVTGITTPLLTKAGLNDTRFKMIEEKDHASRMQTMINYGQGCIALPGGLGTLEECMTVSVMN